jgi:excisionase family DNA binding protein
MAADLSTLTVEELLTLLRSSPLVELVRPPSPWMGPQETASYLGVAVGTVRNWTSARFIPFSKRGRVVRYHRDTIDRWLARGGCAGRTTLADA